MPTQTRDTSAESNSLVATNALAKSVLEERGETSPSADAVADPPRDPDGDGDDPADYGLLSKNVRPLASDPADVCADPLVRCGCGNCPDDEENVVADCPSPEAPTVAWATDTVKRLVRGTTENPHAGLDRADDVYASILVGDREVIDRFGYTTTTILLSFRLSPLRDGRAVPMLELRDQLSQTWGTARDRITYTLRSNPDVHDYEYVWVVSGTEQWATPHLHVLVYADDPTDAVNAHDFENVVQAHCDRHENAEERHHQIHPDGDGGAVSVRHDPPRATDATLTHLRHADDDVRTSGLTRASVYLATQVPRVLIDGPIRGDGRAPEWAWETATWAYASGKDSYGSSRGFGT